MLSGRVRVWTGSSVWGVRLPWLAMLAIFVLACAVPASASESVGVAAWGDNNDGQLGNNTTTNEKEPVEVKIITEAIAVAGGEQHSLALLKDGKVMAWGYNPDGQLGNGTTTTEKEPVEVKGLTEVVAIAAGADHSLAVLKNGKVKAWGDNNDGQLGNGTTTTEKEPVEVKGLTEVVAIAAGADHSLAVLKNGKVKAWGDNNDGQLGNGTTTTEKEPVEVKGLTEATAVAGGEFHSLALLQSGRVKAWGDNNDGQLGNGTTTTEKEPVEVKGLTEVVAIAAGHNHSLAVLKNGKVKAWGDNNDGQLGNGTTTTEKEPVEVKIITEAITVAGGQFHSLALLKNGKVMSWGDNEDGQLGNGATTTEKEPVEVKGLEAVAGGIASGADFSFAAYATGPSNTALPTILGKVEERQTLTASTGTWAGTEPIAYAYQWQSCNSKGESCANISGATSSTYKLTSSNVGGTVRVDVTAKNLVNSISALSVVTSVVAASPPVNTALPAVSGMAESGQLMTVSNGSWEGTPTISYAYQWETCNSKGESCSSISGATASSYRVLNSQVGDTLRATVTADNSAGSEKATSTATATITTGPPVNTELPAISGTAKEGETFSASTGTWVGGEPFSYTYQWKSCNTTGESCSNISGATGSTYKLTSGNVGKTLRIVLTTKNSVSSTEATSTASAVVVAPPSNTALPTISGIEESGQLLAVSNGSWEGTPTIAYAYQWESCNSKGEGCSTISGATASTYRVLNSQVGDTLRAIVTASNSVGSEKAMSAATVTITTGPPTETELPVISGKAEEGQTLSGSTGVWSGGEPFTYAYQWKSCSSSGESCSNISGATSSTFNLTSSYVGKTLRLTVTAKDSIGSSEVSSSASAVVIVPAPPSYTALPAISGTSRDGQVFSASTGSWSGTTPISYTYQWQSCNLDGEECQNVEGATGQTYTLTSGNLETTLKVVVTATNSLGSAHATSWASTVIGPGAPSELEAPSVSGNPNSGQTLYANAGDWGGTETEIRYQWEHCNATGGECAIIGGADGSEYTLSESNVGATLRVRVGASNVLGSVTAVSSTTEMISGIVSLLNTWAPNITGTLRSGQTLTANAGSWLGLEAIGYAYQWESCNSNGGDCTNIEGATASSYVLGSRNIDDTLRVRVSANEADGTVSQSSAATQPIAAENTPGSEGSPAVYGTGLKGDMLTATTGIWSGVGATNYSYEWERCNESGEGCSAISGATARTYTITEGDVASTLRALVTATNENGSTTAPSEATSVISRTTLVNVVVPSINGTDEIGQALTAERGIWTGEGALAYTYKWERCNEKGESCSTITGAKEASYTPSSTEVGDTLKLVVTAEGTSGKESATSAVTPAIGSESLEPENLFLPTVEGNLTPGEVMTAQIGTWASSESISYTYQWQKCDEEGEECTDIAGAISSTFKLIEGDINYTLRVIVTGENSLGVVSATSYQSEVVGASKPPANSEAPVINGAAREGAKLFAGNGDWSGSQPLRYHYQWERCNSSGEGCTVIAGATNSSYTAVSGDVGSTLRVKVTATNSIASVSAISTQALVAAGTTANVTEALEVAEATDPSILAPSTAATLEEQIVKPEISDTGEDISSTAGLTSSTISKETPGEFTINTADGELSFAPVDASTNATTTPTIINGTAAAFAGTYHATDTFVRPDALGATMLLQLRSAQAPTSFTWEVGVGSNEELEELPNGSVAVVEPSAGPSLESELPSEVFESSESESAEKPGSEGVKGEAAESELERSLEEEGLLESLPAAPKTSTREIAPKAGELHPQETETRYDDAKNAMIYAQEHTADSTVMVIKTPTVLDATGSTVPSTLKVEGNAVIVTITPSESTKWPATAEIAVSAPTNQVSAAKAPSGHYGFSDPNENTFGLEQKKIVEGKEETTWVNNLDSKLKSGPLHVERARLFLNYNASPTDPHLNDWLKAVKAAGLTPFITLKRCEPVPGSNPCPNHEVRLEEYRNDAKKLMKTLIKGNSERPAVRLWGSWNEPDSAGTALQSDPSGAQKAAYLWGETQRAVEEAGCKHHCTVVAGEFQEYSHHHGYIANYQNAIITAERKHKFPVEVKPTTWGFHDYKDLEHVKGIKEKGTEVLGNYINSEAKDYVRVTRQRFRSAHIWATEQGVLLQDSVKPTPLFIQPELQRLAAKDFLRLNRPAEHIEWAYYYLYHGPSATVIHAKPHAFDSALLQGEGVTEEDGHPAENPRQAYCVLVLGLEGCPAASTTRAAVVSTITSSSGTVSLAVNPEGLATKYLVEYGTTEAYGKTTTATTVANENGEQGETANLSGLEPCTTYHYQAEAENEVNEKEGKPGLGGDEIFKTDCAAATVSISSSGVCASLTNGGVECWGSFDDGWNPPLELDEELPGFSKVTAVSVDGNSSVCAVLSTGGVDCVGSNYEGQLGDNSSKESSIPVAVSGISSATSITSEDGSACALAGSSVDCWGSNRDRVLGTEYPEFPEIAPEECHGYACSRSPLEVSGISATSVSDGGDHVCASSGSVECWGENRFGQLGDGEYTTSGRAVADDIPRTVSGISDAASVSTRESDSCAVLTTGGVDCWGENHYEEVAEGARLGDGLENGPETCQILTESYCSDVPVAVVGISGATEVAVGGGFACARLSTGHVKCWGRAGMLGNGTENKSAEAVEVSGLTNVNSVVAGLDDVCAVLTEGSVECWGDNTFGQITARQPGPNTILSPTRVPGFG